MLHKACVSCIMDVVLLSDKYYELIAGTVNMEKEELRMLTLTSFNSIYMNNVSCASNVIHNVLVHTHTACCAVLSVFGTSRFVFSMHLLVIL